MVKNLKKQHDTILFYRLVRPRNVFLEKGHAAGFYSRGRPRLTRLHWLPTFKFYRRYQKTFPEPTPSPSLLFAVRETSVFLNTIPFFFIVSCGLEVFC